MVFPKGNRLLGFLVWVEVPLPETGKPIWMVSPKLAIEL